MPTPSAGRSAASRTGSSTAPRHRRPPLSARCLVQRRWPPAGRGPSSQRGGLRVPVCRHRLGHAEAGRHRAERARLGRAAIASMVSSTCSASSPEARWRHAPRRARAMSSTPSPRPAAAPAAGMDLQSAAPAGRSLISPSKRFGSGRARVASVPVISTNPCRAQRRVEAEHQRGGRPPAYSIRAETWVGTSTAKLRPGPRAAADDPGVAARWRDSAATCSAGPKAWPARTGSTARCRTAGPRRAGTGTPDRDASSRGRSSASAPGPSAARRSPPTR